MRPYRPWRVCRPGCFVPASLASNVHKRAARDGEWLADPSAWGVPQFSRPRLRFCSGDFDSGCAALADLQPCGCEACHPPRPRSLLLGAPDQGANCGRSRTGWREWW